MCSAAGKATESARRIQRKAEIVDAAREVFLAKGYERASVGEIAARVGMVEGNVFRYFPTKRHILDEVLRQLYEPLIAEVAAGFSRLAGLRARLRFIVWRHVRVYTETPGLARLALHEIRVGTDYPASALHELQRRYTDFLRHALGQAVADGELDRGIDFEMVRALVYGGLEHMMWPVLYGGRRVDLETVSDRFTEGVLHGIRGATRTSDVESRLSRLERLVAGAVDSVAAPRRR